MISKIPDIGFILIFLLILAAGVYVVIVSLSRGIPLDNAWLIAIAISIVGLVVGFIKPRKL